MTYLLKRIALFLVVLVICQTIVAQDTIRFRTMFWNVENLFDTLPDSIKNDSEFLPESIRHWNTKRFKKKINDVSRVIIAMGEWEAPALVGLCEVENDNVMKHLTQYSALKEQGYRYIMTNSPDIRGINIALLYQRDRFKLLNYQSINVIPDRPDRSPTRDILYVCGLLPTKDTLDILLVHFPSRTGGVKETEPYRLNTAKQLKSLADSIISVREHSQLLIMGDFNDYPTSKSIAKVLNATIPSDTIKACKLYHLLANKAAENRDYGSHKYKGEWKLLDHIIVSGNLLSNENFSTGIKKADVVRLPFLLEEDNAYGGYQPYRTYRGMKYIGGYSDHLPVYADFNMILTY